MLELPNMAENITFEEMGHVYRMGSMTIPSVTTVMKPLYSFEGISASVLQYAAERGTNIHYAAEKFLKYGYVSKLDSESQPYFNQFLLWFETLGIPREDVACEVLGYYAAYNYCGTLDIIYRDKKKELHLVDMKTGSVADVDVWSVQQSGYGMIAKSHGVDIKHKEVLHLSPSGYKLYPCSDQTGVFISCLCIHSFMKTKR